jgi:restriction endonuclease S subunit
LEGLEISEISFSKAFSITGEMRWDGEYYQKRFLENEKLIHSFPTDRFTTLCKSIKKGIFDLSPENYIDEGVPFIRTSEIKNPTINFSSTVNISEKINSGNFKTELTPGDLVFTKIGAYIGDVALLPSRYEKYNFSQNVAGATVIDKKNSAYLLAFFLSKEGKNQILRSIMLSGQGKLELDDIRNYQIPIVSGAFKSKLSELLQKKQLLEFKASEKYNQAETILLDTLGIKDSSLSTAGINIKSFIDSFYTTGRLDAEFYQPKFDDLEKLIKNNSPYFKQIEEIQIYNARGLQPDYVENGALDVINSKHILEDHLDYDNFEKTSDIFWELQPKAQVFADDILVYTTGANIGRTNIYQSSKKALASNHVNILRIKGEDPFYVSFVMNSLIGRMQTYKLSAGSAQAELYPKDIAQFLIPFVGDKMQKKIREEIITSLSLKKQAIDLLETAKRAVEIVIEQDENAGMSYIEVNS